MAFVEQDGVPVKHGLGPQGLLCTSFSFLDSLVGHSLFVPGNCSFVIPKKKLSLALGVHFEKPSRVTDARYNNENEIADQDNCARAVYEGIGDLHWLALSHQLFVALALWSWGRQWGHH